MAIHLSMVRALWAGLVWAQRGELGAVEGYRELEEEVGDETGEEVEGLGDVGQRREVMTRLVTALNWEMVARTVGARFRLSFLSRWDQTQPRQWKGTALTNSSWGTHGMNEKTPQWHRKELLKMFINDTYSVQSGQLLRHFSHREVHEAFVFLLGRRLELLLQRPTAVLWRRLAAICQTHQIINDNETGCSSDRSVSAVQ